jgi:hypothetical protein
LSEPWGLSAVVIGPSFPGLNRRKLRYHAENIAVNAVNFAILMQFDANFKRLAEKSEPGA